MANANPFHHLTFRVVHEGRARLSGGSIAGMRELDNKANRPRHVDGLRNAFTALFAKWRRLDEQRVELKSPNMPNGKPLVLLVEEDTDVDFLRSAFGFEIVSEEERGYVLVSVEDFDLAKFNETLQKFLEDKRGGGSAARLYEILDLESSDQHIDRILSDSLREKWPQISDGAALIVNISVASTGAERIPDFTPQADDEEDGDFVKRKANYLERHRQVMERWDEVQRQREVEIERIISTYGGTICSMTQDAGSGTNW